MSLYAPPQAPPRCYATLSGLYLRYIQGAVEIARFHRQGKREFRKSERGRERESVDTRFQGYGMVASSCFFPLVSFCSSFCFCFLTFFLRDAGNLRLKLDRVGLIARARGELLVARISRGRMVKIVLRVISWSN